MKNIFSFPILIGFLVVSLVKPANAEIIEGERAEIIAMTLQAVGKMKGILIIKGYVTERPVPPVEFTDAYVLTDANELLEVGEPINRPLIVNILESVGVQPISYNGGTVWLEYRAKVTCVLPDLCDVSRTN